MATTNVNTEIKPLPKRRSRPRGKMSPEALEAQRVGKVERWTHMAAYYVSPKCVAGNVGSYGPIGRSISARRGWQELQIAESFCRRHLPNNPNAAAAIRSARVALEAAGVNSSTIAFHKAAWLVHDNWKGVRDELRAELDQEKGGERG